LRCRPLESLRHAAKKLKPGAPFLVYFHYRFDNKPLWFRALWRMTNLPRVIISSLPFGLKSPICEVIAAIVYWPLARFARWAEKRGRNISNFPLSIYRNKSFYIMRNDALDRFGTKTEKRFTRNEIASMMQAAGLEKITFGDKPPFWNAVGYKAA
jgi:hypothetical protein